MSEEKPLQRKGDLIDVGSEVLVKLRNELMTLRGSAKILTTKLEEWTKDLKLAKDDIVNKERALNLIKERTEVLNIRTARGQQNARKTLTKNLSAVRMRAKRLEKLIEEQPALIATLHDRITETEERLNRLQAGKKTHSS
ncbi:MAG: hypothetical protein KBD05_00290 [Candidatus Pacebacteria bacterium]|nr:hypothetical protein [Candidatus Paceibacterota bacterium]